MSNCTHREIALIRSDEHCPSFESAPILSDFFRGPITTHLRLPPLLPFFFYNYPSLPLFPFLFKLFPISLSSAERPIHKKFPKKHKRVSVRGLSLFPFQHPAFGPHVSPMPCGPPLLNGRRAPPRTYKPHGRNRHGKGERKDKLSIFASIATVGSKVEVVIDDCAGKQPPLLWCSHDTPTSQPWLARTTRANACSLTQGSY